MSPCIGSATQFQALREFLKQSDYEEQTILSRMGIRGLHESLGMRSTGPPDDCLELLIQLFLLSEPAADATLRALTPKGIPELLNALGLVASDAEGRTRATVSLYPLDGVYVVSDVNQNSERDSDEDAAPRVFSAATPQTSEFLRMLPMDPCPAFLELCAGAGAAAMIAASRYAAQAYAFDISERSTLFAEFGRRLNGLNNLTVLQGDLYAPSGRRSFDRIAAHPPYVPSLRSEQLFRDGGEDGEWLTRRIIEGLPNYLYPGGQFYCLCLMAEIATDPLVERIRRWLREREKEFDLVVVVRLAADPAKLIFDNWSPRYSQPGDWQRWQSVLRRNRIERFLYVTLLLEKHAAESRPLTLMREAGEKCTTAYVRELLRWEQKLAHKGLDAAVDGLRPVAAPEISLTTSQALRDGKCAEKHHSYRVDNPFRFEFEGDSWVGDLLERASGTMTVRELHRAFAPPGVEWEGFAGVVAALVSGGLLRQSA